MKKRIEWIDMLKGYAICMIIYGHIEFAPAYIKNFLSPIALTAFFIASGYTFRSGQNFIPFFIKKVKTLLCPWLVFGSFNILLTGILTFSRQLPLKEQFLCLFLQIRGKNDGLWFFPCLFVCLILFYVIDRILPNKIIFFLFQSFLLSVSVVYDLTIAIPLPWHIQMWGNCLFYMSLGYLYCIFKDHLAFLETYPVMAAAFMIYLFSFILYQSIEPVDSINFHHCGSHVLFYFILNFSGILFSINFAQRTPTPPSMIKYAGKNSLLYFAFHGKPKRLLTVFFMKLHLISETNFFLCLILSILELFILIFLLPIPCYIINRFFPFLLGKNRAAEP